MHGTDKTEYERAFMIWPSARLESGRRYIVAIRDVVYDTNGSLIPARYACHSNRPCQHTNPLHARRSCLGYGFTLPVRWLTWARLCLAILSQPRVRGAS